MSVQSAFTKIVYFKSCFVVPWTLNILCTLVSVQGTTHRLYLGHIINLFLSAVKFACLLTFMSDNFKENAEKQGEKEIGQAR